MDRMQDISAEASLPPQDGVCDQDLCQNATQLEPSAEATAPASATAKRPVRHRILLADHIDRQFPLIRSA